MILTVSLFYGYCNLNPPYHSCFLKWWWSRDSGLPRSNKFKKIENHPFCSLSIPLSHQSTWFLIQTRGGHYLTLLTLGQFHEMSQIWPTLAKTTSSFKLITANWYLWLSIKFDLTKSIGLIWNNALKTDKNRLFDKTF